VAKTFPATIVSITT